MDVCRTGTFLCDGMCRPLSTVGVCDGRRDCDDGSDEVLCGRAVPVAAARLPHHGLSAKAARTRPMTPEDIYQAPTPDVVTTTVLPTIVGCVLLVAAMLYGIKRCKQWELDRLMEMRRTRRVVQRITQRLREKNMHTLQTMRTLRKRRLAAMAAARAAAERDCSAVSCTSELDRDSASSDDPLVRRARRRATAAAAGAVPPGVGAAAATAEAVEEGAEGAGGAAGPPIYDAIFPFASGDSPPPAYEEAILDQYYYELFCQTDEPDRRSVSSGRSIFSRGSSTATAGGTASSSSSAHRLPTSGSASSVGTNSSGGNGEAAAEGKPVHRRRRPNSARVSTAPPAANGTGAPAVVKTAGAANMFMVQQLKRNNEVRADDTLGKGLHTFTVPVVAHHRPSASAGDIELVSLQQSAGSAAGGANDGGNATSSAAAASGTKHKSILSI